MSTRIQSIIARNLAGQSTPAENAELQEWLSKSLSNKKQFDDYQRIWKLTDLNNNNFKVDAAWSDFEKRIRENKGTVPVEAPIVKISSRKLHPLTILVRVAAVFVLVFASWFLLQTVNDSKSVMITAEKLQDNPSLLPDGTTVEMNKGSKLLHNTKFSHKNRNIEFEGQAFFNVAHDPDHPFIIKANGVGIKVLGTSFHMLAETGSHEVTVHLESGKLKIFPLNGKSSPEMETILIPGEMVVYNSESNTFVKSFFKNRNFMAWSTGELIFDNTPLKDVLNDLEIAYDINFVNEADIDALKLTANFEDESSEAILQTLEIVFNLQFTRQDDIVRIH